MTEAERITELEAKLKDCDEKIERLRADLTEALDTVDQVRERLEDSHAMVQRCIDMFGMQQDDVGRYVFDPHQTELWDAHLKQLDVNKKLVRDWNKFADRYNRTVDPRPVGRPLRADENQIADVKKRRTAGDSLRACRHASPGFAFERTARASHILFEYFRKPSVLDIRNSRLAINWSSFIRSHLRPRPEPFRLLLRTVSMIHQTISVNL